MQRPNRSSSNPKSNPSVAIHLAAHLCCEGSSAASSDHRRASSACASCSRIWGARSS